MNAYLLSAQWRDATVYKILMVDVKHVEPWLRHAIRYTRRRSKSILRQTFSP